MNNLVIRTDASTAIGTGHVMRCLALAHGWQEQGGEAIFILANGLSSIELRLINEEMKIFPMTADAGSADDARATVKIASEADAEWVVVDGYHFGAKYQKIIKDAGLSLLLIDDYGHADHYYADIVLNQNISADASLYEKKEPYTRLLLGTKYALIRREFLKFAGRKRKIPDVARKVLVTLGGSDRQNITLQVIMALQKVPVEELEIVVIVGSANPHYEELCETTKNFPTIKIINNGADIPALMAWADIAVSGAGSTCWELAFLNAPMLLIILGDNQRPLAEKLHSTRAAISLGEARNAMNFFPVELEKILASADLRRQLSANAGRIIDGNGSDRVVMRMRDLPLWLRKADPEDCKILWEWANDPDVRRHAFNPNPIDMDTHRQWYQKKQADPDCCQFIAINSGDIPVGQIRFDRSGDDAEIDVSVDKKWRNMGCGASLIKIGCDWLFGHTSVLRVHAYVKIENVTSIKSFETAGFFNTGKMIMQGAYAIHFIKERSEGQRNEIT